MVGYQYGNAANMLMDEPIPANATLELKPWCVKLLEHN